LQVPQQLAVADAVALLVFDEVVEFEGLEQFPYGSESERALVLGVLQLPEAEAAQLVREDLPSEGPLVGGAYLVQVDLMQVVEAEVEVGRGRQVAVEGVQHLRQVLGGDGHLKLVELAEFPVELSHPGGRDQLSLMVLVPVEELPQEHEGDVVDLPVVVVVGVLKPLGEVEVILALLVELVNVGKFLLPLFEELGPGVVLLLRHLPAGLHVLLPPEVSSEGHHLFEESLVEWRVILMIRHAQAFPSVLEDLLAHRPG